ncbi:MAG TPA: citramalate synthase, partial [Armatimonadota bacterium]|nr:citramalate synthase [Armatimonadota bacterium]
MSRIEVYDTTLRDGAQGEGISFSVEDKRRITQLLDELGVDYVEGGWPNPSSPRDTEFFAVARELDLKHVKLAAFGSTRRAGVEAADDPQLAALISSDAPVITIFGKSWDLHVEHVLRCSRDENLMMIEDSVAFLKASGRQVFYDAEHFFDGWRSDAEYALETLRAAQRGGAERIILCDTNGGRMLDEIVEATHQSLEAVDVPMGIHTHNDSGCAVASSLAAVQAGCVQVQGTINGYGERCGNADLCVVVPNLALKMGHECLVAEDGLHRMASTSRMVAEIAMRDHDARQPYVGESAFAHKAGMHQDGISKIAESFEHVPPASVGGERRLILSDQAGAAAIVEKIKHLYPDMTKKSPEVREILARVKELEHEGFEFETAEASFELLAREVVEGRSKLFNVNRLTVLVKETARDAEEVFSEAALQLKINGDQVSGVADGDGPVHALDSAVRQAIGDRFPGLADLRLTDFKVRVVSGKQGTASKVRVTITSTNGTEHWMTVGAHENIIWASWQALTDSYHYGLLIANGS